MFGDANGVWTEIPGIQVDLGSYTGTAILTFSLNPWGHSNWWERVPLWIWSVMLASIPNSGTMSRNGTVRIANEGTRIFSVLQVADNDTAVGGLQYMSVFNPCELAKITLENLGEAGLGDAGLGYVPVYVLWISLGLFLNDCSIIWLHRSTERKKGTRN